MRMPNGTHLNEDHYFPEIVDPKTLEPVAPGETGELVFTHLTKEGMPLLRYRTKDLTALHYENVLADVHWYVWIVFSGVVMICSLYAV